MHKQKKKSKILREELVGIEHARTEVIEMREKVDGLQKQAEGQARAKQQVEEKVSIYLSIYLSYLSILSINQSIYLLIYLSIYLYITEYHYITEKTFASGRATPLY